MTSAFDEVGLVSDAELGLRLERLVSVDRRLTAKLLVHLSEAQEREIYLALGFSHMFSYCTDALRMSVDEAYLRIKAAEICRRFPLVLERISTGELNLTGIKLIGKYLTADNHVQVLDRVNGLSKRQIELVVAELDPKADVKASLRRASSTPLSPGRFKLQVTLDQETHDDLEQLQDLLRHQNPSGDLTRIIKRAVRELREREMKRQHGHIKQSQPRAADKKPPVRSGTENLSKRSRYVPRAVRRKVFARDGGQCTFESADGRRCSERGFLELDHHTTTFARGGAQTADNLRLACRAHNRFFANQEYGRELMRTKVTEAIAHRSF